jgi:alkylation response protein AidB-like acyl-CoA dehydrogenase
MDFRDTPDEAEFRRGLRTWLAENLPADWSEREPHVGRYDVDFARDWARRLDDAGYVGLTWPREYGGGGAPYTHQAIFLEETARAGAPDHLGVIGRLVCGRLDRSSSPTGPSARHRANHL